MTHFRTCPLCEATCGLAITTRGAEITAIRGDADDVFSHGFICPKAYALKDLDADPEVDVVQGLQGGFGAMNVVPGRGSKVHTKSSQRHSSRWPRAKWPECRC